MSPGEKKRVKHLAGGGWNGGPGGGGDEGQGVHQGGEDQGGCLENERRGALNETSVVIKSFQQCLYPEENKLNQWKHTVLNFV